MAKASNHSFRFGVVGNRHSNVRIARESRFRARGNDESAD